MIDWAIAIIAAVAGFAAIWFSARQSGVAAAEAEQDEARLAATRQAQEVENEVEALDRDTLKRRARRWVRGPKG